jgi:hypothetical protein
MAMALPIDTSSTKWQEFQQWFHKESDRGAALIAGGYVENALGIYLRKLLVNTEVEKNYLPALDHSKTSHKEQFSRTHSALLVNNPTTN